MGNNKYCHVEGYALVNFGRFSGENSFWPNCTPELQSVFLNMFDLGYQ